MEVELTAPERIKICSVLAETKAQNIQDFGLLIDIIGSIALDEQERTLVEWKDSYREDGSFLGAGWKEGSLPKVGPRKFDLTDRIVIRLTAALKAWPHYDWAKDSTWVRTVFPKFSIKLGDSG